MKANSALRLVAALVAAIGVPGLIGSTITLNLDPVNYTSPPGGEYHATPSADIAGVLAAYSPLAKDATGFQTFCLEANEHFTPGKAYVAVMNDRAIAGGGNAYHAAVTPGADILSLGTTWLYRQFAQGTLPGYTYAYGAGRVASALVLQEAIWGLEDEIPLNLANPYVIAAYGAFVDPLADAPAGAYGVSALNLTLKDGTLKQDVLVFTTPDGGASVALLGVALATLGIIGRRTAKA